MEKPIKTLLLIDDDENFRKILSLVMRGIPDQIIEATDGKSGIELIKKHKPQVIISDYNMPGLNGLELLKQLKEEDSKVPVIWLTGNGTRELFRDAWRFGVYDFFEKPVDTQLLKESVKSAFNFGEKFIVDRKPNFLTRVKHKDVQLMLETELYENLIEHCAQKGISLTTLLHHLISEELSKKK